MRPTSWRLSVLLVVGGQSSACGLLEEMTSWKTVQWPLHAVQASPQVEAGTPFTLYGDFDGACEGSETLTVTLNESEKVLQVKLFQRMKSPSICPAMVFMERASQNFTLSMPGTYRVEGARMGAYSTIEVVAAGQSVPNWTPEPLSRTSSGGREWRNSRLAALFVSGCANKSVFSLASAFM